MKTIEVMSKCHHENVKEWTPEEGSPAFDRETPVYSFDKCQRIADRVLGVLNNELGIRVDMDELKGRGKQREVAYARQAIWLVLRDHYSVTFERLGLLMNRNHTTVINGINAMRARASVPGIDARAMCAVYLRLGIVPKFYLHGWNG